MTPSHTPAITLHKVRLSLGGFVVLAFSVAVLIYLAFNLGHHSSAIRPTVIEERQYDKFRASKIEMLQIDYDGSIIKLSADEIIHRKRKCKLFEYQNLKELYCNHIVFDIYPDKKKRLRYAYKYSIPFNLLVKSVNIVPVTGDAKLIESYLQKTSDVELDLLTRVLFDNLSLNIHYPTGRSFVINAEKASISGDYQNLVLGGDVKIISPHGEVIHALQAVLSRRFDGILFPSGHFWRKTHRQQKAFYRLTSGGWLVRLPQSPSIKYNDLLEAKEDEFFGKILGRLPPYERIMLGVTTMQ